ITITRTSKTKIKVPNREHAAPTFIILSIYLIIISNKKNTIQVLILCGSIATKLYGLLFETRSNLLLKYWNGSKSYVCLSHNSCTASKYTFLGFPFILNISCVKTCDTLVQFLSA